MLKWTLNNKRIEPIAQFTAVLDPGRITKRRSMGQPLHALRTAAGAAAAIEAVAASAAAVPKSAASAPRRRSVASGEFTQQQRRYQRHNQRHNNKENHVIASPHPLVAVHRAGGAASTPYAHQSSALRDVGNTTPQRRSLNSVLSTTPLRKRHLPPSPLLAVRRQTPVAPASPQPAQTEAQMPAQVPAFFAHPRYFPAAVATDLNQNMIPAAPETATATAPAAGLTPLSRRLAELRFSKMSIQRHQIFDPLSQCCDDEEDANMSSKALNDTALDQMIDEILYSTRKVKPVVGMPVIPVPPAPQVTPNTTLQAMVGPVAPAAAPCSSNQASMETSEAVAELLRSPEPEVCQLRRQGGLRRKRGQRCVAGEQPQNGRQMDVLMASHPYLRQSIELLASLETPPKKMRWA